MLGFFRLLLAVGVALAHLDLLTPGTSRSLVGAFFVVSGYLMALTLATNYPTPAGRLPAPGAFYWNRFLRIYPLHVCLSVVIVLGGLAGAFYLPRWPTAGGFLASLTLFHDHADTLIRPAWSLFYEVLFYLAVPFLVLRGRFAAAAAAGCLACLAWQGELVALADPFMAHRGIFDLSVAGPLAGLHFLLGLGVHEAKRRLDLRLATGRELQLAVLVALGVLAIATCAPVQHLAFAGVDAAWGRALNLAVLVLTAAFLLAWDERHEAGWSVRAGDLCYPVYMIHWPVFFYVPGGHQLGGLGATFLAAFAWLALERRTFARLRCARKAPAGAVPEQAPTPAADRPTVPAA